jgi:FAD/FMN-containing dehydrogenase
MIDWNAFITTLTGLDVIVPNSELRTPNSELKVDPAQITKLSQDYFHFSPILQTQLAGKVGDLVVRPHSEAEVLQVAGACVRYRVPLTVRGAGTGNYGQCVPLAGGVILDLSRMNQIHWIKPSMACVEPGVKLAALDKQAREMGWEMRMMPSTYRTATIGGFIGGGSGGIGSINYGFLSDRGNLCGVRVVTMEDQPQVMILRGDEVQKVNHAYGTNGIITELEIPLAPTYPWAEVVVQFADFMDAVRFGQKLGNSDGLVKKLICICAWPIPTYFTALKSYIAPESHVALLLIAESSLELFQALVQEFQGEICYERSAQEANKGITLMEYSWNHTTLHARSFDPGLTYLQTLFLDEGSGDLKCIEDLYHHFGDEVIMHLEFIRSQGKTTATGLQLVRYTTEARLQEIMQYHEDHQAIIFNPHTYILEDGGRKCVDPVQLAFKEAIDPYGLLNPGKMRAWQARRNFA